MLMAKCPECNNELTDEMIAVNMCFECGYIIDKNLFDDTVSEDKSYSMNEIAESIIKQENIQKVRFNEKLSQHLLTSGFNFEGFKIVKYINILSGETVIGTGFINELKASVSDSFGTESNAFSSKLESAKQSALNKLIAKSISLGGNALIGVDFDYITFFNNMIGVSANGTSVFIEKL